MAHDQLEIYPAEIDLRQRAFAAGLHCPVVDEYDAALLQGVRSRRNVARAEAEAHQGLVPADLLRPGRRLDKLQIELAAGTFEQRALRQDAEIYALRHHREAEQALIEVQPVGGAVDEDGLYHAEVVQAGDRGRPRIDARQRHEIDVVDREIPVTVDEINEAVAHAVDSRNVQLHGGSPCGHLPGAEVERVPVRVGRVAHPQRDRRHGWGAPRS